MWGRFQFEVEKYPLTESQALGQLRILAAGGSGGGHTGLGIRKCHAGLPSPTWSSLQSDLSLETLCIMAKYTQENLPVSTICKFTVQWD